MTGYLVHLTVVEHLANRLTDMVRPYSAVRVKGDSFGKGGCQISQNRHLTIESNLHKFICYYVYSMEMDAHLKWEWMLIYTPLKTLFL